LRWWFGVLVEYDRSLKAVPRLFRFGHGFELGAIRDSDNAPLHSDNAGTLPFMETFVNVLARCPHHVGEFGLRQPNVRANSILGSSALLVDDPKKCFGGRPARRTTESALSITAP
jgi:hypothetical protein